MNNPIPINKILFINIETVPQNQDFNNLTSEMQYLYKNKTVFKRKEDDDLAEYYKNNAGVLAEFGKIICISVGIIYFNDDSEQTFKSKSFYGDDENEILLNLKQLLDEKYSNSDAYLCAHNGKEFDFPYIARRMLINGLQLPNILNISGLKPWEVKHIDTMELWKFGDRKHYTSIKLLSAILCISLPENNIDASKISSIYYNHNNIDKIAIYCEKDTFAVAQIYLKMKGIAPVLIENNKSLVEINQ
ncbi:MAG: ribonuclease H-like domain-containing protein [Ichthyobacteriaceae bacterium]|nr:ribonuclease H-like domain-containing protein [Ichthyobacteriaceae bacterium]